MNKIKNNIIQQLGEILEARKGAAADTSYVASLYAGGIDKILKKVGEESAEFIMAAKAGSDAETVYETADVWFHTLVALAHRGIPAEAVLQELERRFGLSGLEEKAQRE